MKNNINRQRKKNHNDEPGNGTDEDSYSLQYVFSWNLYRNFNKQCAAFSDRRNELYVTQVIFYPIKHTI